MLHERVGKEPRLPELLPLPLILGQPQGLGQIQRMAGILEGLLGVIPGAGLDVLKIHAVMLDGANP